MAADTRSLLWRMPVAVRRGWLVFDRPFAPAGREGASPETSLRGVLFAALLAQGCRYDGACAYTPCGHPCRAPAACPMGWLYQPRCPHQRRDHPSPLGVMLDTGQPACWEVALRFWGKRAVDCQDMVCHALGAAGGAGLADARGNALFACRWEAPPALEPLAAHCALGETVPERAWLHFETPCQSRARDLARLLANTAHALAQWALVDAGASAAMGKSGCDEVADAVRAEAAAALDGLGVAWVDQRCAAVGRRRSRTNRGGFDLKGFTGSARLTGDLAACWPWLAMLALRGAGGRGSFGLGRVSLVAELGGRPRA